jgi:ferredoxin
MTETPSEDYTVQPSDDPAGWVTAVVQDFVRESPENTLRIPPTPRPYEDYRAYCLFFADGTCGECIARCPVGAITEAGHDKARCRAHARGMEEFVRANFGFEGYGCGLCQTGVPCESGVPGGR